MLDELDKEFSGGRLMLWTWERIMQETFPAYDEKTADFVQHNFVHLVLHNAYIKTIVDYMETANRKARLN